MSSLVSPPRCGCTVCLARAVQWGVDLWPVVTYPKRAVPVVLMLGPWYGRIPGRVMLYDSPGRMANAVPAQPEAHPDARCLCPRRYIHGPPM